MDSNELLSLIIIMSKACAESMMFLVSLYTAKDFINTYNIKKDFKNKDIHTVSIPPTQIENNTNIDINTFINSKYSNPIIEFYNFMITKYPKEYLINFYNNLKSLTIIKDDKLKLKGYGGIYEPKDNLIKINNPKDIYHELFHMASCYYDKDETNRAYCGFWQVPIKDVKDDIGLSLNEGYTELLAYRYFGKKYKKPLIYPNEVNMAVKLEKVIGNKEMEHMYLTADLSSLITNLKKYTTGDKVHDFITRLDIISKHSSNILLEYNDIIEDNIIYVWEFLLKIYTEKLKTELDNHLIDEETFVNNSINYLKSLKNNVTIGGYTYHPVEIVSMLSNWENILLKNKQTKTYKKVK